MLGVWNPCQTRPSSPLPVSDLLARLGDRTCGYLSQLRFHYGIMRVGVLGEVRMDEMGGKRVYNAVTCVDPISFTPSSSILFLVPFGGVSHIVYQVHK